MDVDGPCAAPQGEEITKSMSQPLLNMGMILLTISFILGQIYYITGNFFGFNNRWVTWGKFKKQGSTL